MASGKLFQSEGAYGNMGKKMTWKETNGKKGVNSLGIKVTTQTRALMRFVSVWRRAQAMEDFE